SSCFGSVNALKRDMAAEVCAVLAAAAAKNNDKVGLIIFTDQVECFVPPRKGTKHIFKVIREALYFKPRGVGTDIGRCLKYLEMVTTKRAVVFVISDFYAEGIKKPLSVSSRRHDLIAVNILDPRDTDIPDAGMIELEDAETGRRHLVDSSLRSFRDNYRNIALKKQEERKRFFYSLGIDRIEISTAKPYEEALIRFFGSRKTRK
ncbi:MAG: VWA domain-containing protein, partial [Candidatus Omnitrophica bacterium]|nr:VWA domain-containing protein [Candidatus Omnitrophota bacterium]